MSIPPNTQANRPLEVITPLGGDALLLVSFSGRESISKLFDFTLDVLANSQRKVPFEKLLGHPLTVRLELPGRKQRFFQGICNQVSQGASDHHFTHYQLGMVPALWLLTKRVQCRIFQQMTVPDILEEVFESLDVAFEITGTFPPRDYCVQYRETDFHFASRLMEEEGIWYFFKNRPDGQTLVVANTPRSHPDVPDPTTVIYENVRGGNRKGEERIHAWQKTQALCSGKVTLWDHCFELPHKHLEAERRINGSVPVGGADHQLLLPRNAALEVFDYPGGYAQRFDGVDPGGGSRAGDLSKIYEDNKRTAAIRMEQEAMTGLLVEGASDCRHFAAGCKLTVATLPTDPLARLLQLEGAYVLTSVLHSARQGGDFRSGGRGPFSYHNTFTALPLAQPFRPLRLTPKPVIHGTQTAVVVGPPGEEIAVDKYGRVKVKFHWDRDPKRDLDSSCWVRVAQIWAGKRWGAHFWPRVGHEVVVAFEEGDPDRPIIVGSVYNAEDMPPYELPKHKTLSGIKSRSSPKGTDSNFNEIRFEDKRGAEELYIHAERNLTVTAEANESRSIGGNRTTTVGGSCRTAVQGDLYYTVLGPLGMATFVAGNYSLEVGKQVVLQAQDDVKIRSESGIGITGKGGISLASQDGPISSFAGEGYSFLTFKTITLAASEGLLLDCAGGIIGIDSGGNIYINGPSVNINSGTLPPFMAEAQELSKKAAEANSPSKASQQEAEAPSLSPVDDPIDPSLVPAIQP